MIKRFYFGHPPLVSSSTLSENRCQWYGNACHCNFGNKQKLCVKDHMAHVTPSLTYTAHRAGVFFDRDGVLNVDHGYVYARDNFTWVEGAIEAVRAVKEAGYVALVVTNQSGIGRGYYTLQAMHELHSWMNEELKRFGAGIDAFYDCPYHPEAKITAYRDANHPDR